METFTKFLPVRLNNP